MVFGVGDVICWELEWGILNEWMCLLYIKGLVVGVEVGLGDRRGWDNGKCGWGNVGWIYFK